MSEFCQSKYRQGGLEVQCQLLDLHSGDHKWKTSGMLFQWPHSVSEHDQLLDLYLCHLALCKTPARGANR